MYATINALSDSTVVSSIINSLGTTVAGVSFLFTVMFFLACAAGIFAIIADAMSLCKDIEMAGETCAALMPKAKSKSNGLNKAQVRVVNALTQGAYELWKREMRDWRPSKKYNLDEVVALLNQGLTASAIESWLDEQEYQQLFS